MWCGWLMVSRVPCLFGTIYAFKRICCTGVGVQNHDDRVSQRIDISSQLFRLLLSTLNHPPRADHTVHHIIVAVVGRPSSQVKRSSSAIHYITLYKLNLLLLLLAQDQLTNGVSELYTIKH